MAYAPRKYEIAGFDLLGERQDDGSIKLGSKPRFSPDDRTHLPAFPEEVEVGGIVYKLEFVKENQGEWRKTAPPDHPGLRICWGVYV